MGLYLGFNGVSIRFTKVLIVFNMVWVGFDSGHRWTRLRGVPGSRQGSRGLGATQASVHPGLSHVGSHANFEFMLQGSGRKSTAPGRIMI